MAGQNFSSITLSEQLSSIFARPVSKQDIDECTREFVQTIYSQFLVDFGESIEDLNQLPINVPNLVSEYPDAFMSTFTILGLARTIKKYLNLIYKESDFNYFDLLKPSPDRTRHFFAKFINFYEHVINKIQYFDDIQDESEARKLELEKLKDNIIIKKKLLDKKKRNNLELDMVYQQELEAVTELKNKIEVAQNEKIDLRTNVDSIKNDTAAIGTQIIDVDLNYCQYLESLENLKTEIILDNERILIEEKELQLKHCRNQNLGITDEFKDLQEKIQFSKRLDDIADTINSSLKEQEQDEVKKLEIETAKKDAVKETSDLADKQDELEQCIQAISEEISELQENRAQNLNYKESKKNALIQELKQLQLNEEEIYRSEQEFEIVEHDLVEENAAILEKIKVIDNDLAQFVSIANDTHLEMVELMNNMCPVNDK